MPKRTRRRRRSQDDPPPKVARALEAARKFIEDCYASPIAQKYQKLYEEMERSPVLPPRTPEPQPAPPESEKAKSLVPKQPPASKSREQEACRQFAARKYPHGYDSIRTNVIMHAAELDKEFKRTVAPFPKRDTWSRALGRRKDRRKS